MLLPIGATVRCHDGVTGRLKYVVFDPHDGEVTHLIVERGQLLHRDVIVPVAWVESSTDDEIVLNATVAEINDLPEYQPNDFATAPRATHMPEGYLLEETRIFVGPYTVDGKPGVMPIVIRNVRVEAATEDNNVIEDDGVLLRRGMTVQSADGRNLGVVDHLVVDPADHRLTHFVVRRGALWKREARVVPIERVELVTDRRVALNMTAEEFTNMPEYQPPASDEQIALELQRALDTDARTRDASLAVSVSGGVVRLIGNMTDAVRNAARSLAQRIRGVIGFEEDIPPLPEPPLRIGATVHATDGRFGKLSKVVVDPHVRRVTHLIVSRGLPLSEEIVIPIERVDHTEASDIYLDGTIDELNRYPRYSEEAFVTPDAEWETLAPFIAADTLFWGGPYIGVVPPVVPTVHHVVSVGVPEDEVVMRRGASVFYGDKEVGTLDHVLFEPQQGTLTHLVVKARERGRRVIVPAEWVSVIDADEIFLREWQPDRPGVPEYVAQREDAEIRNEINTNLRTNPALGSVEAQVEDGVAHLSGNVATVADQVAADAIARNVSGVLDVRNKLSTDNLLFEIITMALAGDRRTARIPIEVIVDRGIVTLKGTVPSLEAKHAAETITRRVPGVITVLSELEVRSGDGALVVPPVGYVPPLRNG